MTPLLKPEEVAEILRVSSRTVRRMGEAGVLERVHIGGRLTRYRADSIEALIHPQDDDGRPASRPCAPTEEGITSAHRTAA